MEVFGPAWADYQNKIENKWRATVEPDDLVLVAGDISWAMALKDASVDLNWIESLPGTKVLIKETMTTGGARSLRPNKSCPPRSI